MTRIHLTATRGAASLLRRHIGLGTGLFLVSAEPVKKIAKLRTGRIPVRAYASRLKLNERVAGANSILVFGFRRVEFLVPHQFDVADGSCVVQKQQEVLEEFQVFLKLLP